MLTEQEHMLMGKLAEIMIEFEKMAGDTHNRPHDLHEVALHIHALQHTVLAQSAARAYPALYRLLGEAFSYD